VTFDHGELNIPPKPRKESLMTPDDTRHGTRRGYNAGCGCDDCKHARESALSGESARMETTPFGMQ
jgi:hypothetical protein